MASLPPPVFCSPFGADYHTRCPIPGMPMGFVATFFIALGLSADAFAVSVSNGFSSRRPRIGEALRFGIAFGSFQALMPLIGWLAGSGMAGLFESTDHWVAFGLLAFIGGKMVFEGIWGETTNDEGKPVTFWVLLILSVATSIDALAVGISLSLLNARIFMPAMLIGVTTLCVSTAGFLLGKRLGSFFGRRVEIAGGIILVAIGAKILIDHLIRGVAGQV